MFLEVTQEADPRDFACLVFFRSLWLIRCRAPQTFGQILLLGPKVSRPVMGEPVLRCNISFSRVHCT